VTLTASVIHGSLTLIAVDGNRGRAAGALLLVTHRLAPLRIFSLIPEATLAAQTATSTTSQHVPLSLVDV